MEAAQLATEFYTAMNTRDFSSMNKFYAPEVQFSDPVFPSLSSSQTKNMWEMLLKAAKNFTVEHKVTSSGSDFVEVDWIARYDFSKTGRPVANHIHTRMEIKNGLIVKQKDVFDLYKWSQQALGVPGYVFGWTTFMQKKIQKTASQNLAKYEASRGGANAP